MSMNLSRELANALMNIWKSHDEGNIIEGFEAAYKLYSLLGCKDEPNCSVAAMLTISAYFVSDIAEKYQGKNEEKEDEYYRMAGELLKFSRKLCDLEPNSADFTWRWWKAYRHKDRNKVKKYLKEEHRSQFKNLEKEKCAEECSEKIMEAAEFHKKRNWNKVLEVLTEYFEIYLKCIYKD